MVAKRQHLKLAAFLLAITVLLLLVITIVGRFTLWDTRETYYVVSEESVLGLERGAPVTMRGVDVGRVESIALDTDDYASVRISLDIDEEVPVPANAVAFIRMSGLTGLKVVDIGEGDLASGVLEPGSRIPLEPTALDKIEDRAVELARRASKVMEDAHRLTENLVRFSEALEQSDVETIVKRVERILRKLDAAASDLRTTMKAGRTGIEDITDVADDLGKLVRQATRMLRGNQNDLRSAVRNLRQAARNLQEFSRQIRSRPSRILRSDPPEPRELP